MNFVRLLFVVVERLFASGLLGDRAHRPTSYFGRYLFVAVAFFVGGVSTKASAHVFEISDRDGTAVMLPAEAADLPCSLSCEVTEGHPLAAISERAITRTTAPTMPDAWRGALIAAASKAQISPELLAALIHQESGWRTDAHSPKGAIGLAQLMPNTARQLGVDPLDPASNLLGGARYLRAMLDRFGGDVALALAAYNAGPTRVSHAHGVPAIAETRAYVNHVLERLTEVQPTAIQGIFP